MPPPPSLASSMAMATGVHHNTISASPALATASPRRTTVALDGASLAAPSPTLLASGTTPDAVGVAVYDKQLLWKHHGQRKVDHLTLERLSQDDRECTFAPKINRSSSNTRKPAAVSLVPSVLTALSADVVRDFGVVSPQSCDSDGGRSEGSSSQYSSSSPRTMRSVESADLRGDRAMNQDECEDRDDDVPLHPTESQESSIRLHLARQERAREEALRAHHRLASTQPRKDFTKVTAARPFELSVTNRKPRRSTSASPTRRPRRTTRTITPVASARAGARINSGGGGVQPLVKRRSQGALPDVGSGALANGAAATEQEESSLNTTAATSDAPAMQWQQERDTLLAIIDTQRRELERRERAQDDAARLAETFAAAVKGFTQRLESVERTTASELSEMKQLLARQAAATDLLLHALGLSSTSASAPPPPPAASSPVPPPPPPSSARRETK